MNYVNIDLMFGCQSCVSSNSPNAPDFPAGQEDRDILQKDETSATFDSASCARLFFKQISIIGERKCFQSIEKLS